MDLNFEKMQEMQVELQEKYKEKWPPISPESARDKLLWMMIEAGEMADVIKKDGDERIMKERQSRDHFIEELCDTLMYLNDVMLCYRIEPEELEAKYRQKHERNTAMPRCIASAQRPRLPRWSAAPAEWWRRRPRRGYRAG
jgi:NTP pyrophosphatase (non-canonical NTP hydrolase)